MSRLRILFSLTVLCLLTFSAQPAAARALLGISYPEQANTQVAYDDNLARQIEAASENLITVYNYADLQTLFSMLSTFKKLDAVLIPRQAYQDQQDEALALLADVQVSDRRGLTSLVLVTRAGLDENQRFQLLEGYQELLMSTDGLGLLERYAVSQAEPELAGALQMAPPAKLAGNIAPPAVATTPPPKPVQRPAPATVPPAPPTKARRWAPHAELTSTLGNERSLGEAALFLPLVQRLDRILFADLRFQLDDADSQEGNFGLGYRQLATEWILGGYAFYDVRETGYDNRFRQWTLGAEALTERYDGRVNIYLADEDEAAIPGAMVTSEPYYLGRNLAYTYRDRYEKSMSGFDVEIGGILPLRMTPEIRAYVGSYYFDAPHVDTISGPKARLAVRFQDLFAWPHSLLELGGEIRHDDERDTDYALTARLRIPLGVTVRSPAPDTLSALERRLTERVVRHPDIVTTQRDIRGMTLLSRGGSQLDIAHVTDGPAGDGTAEAPYGSLTAAAGTTSDIVLLHADSVFDGQAYQLADGQRLLGDFDGARHLIETDQLGTIILPRASTGTAIPVIQNTSGPALTLGSDTAVSHVVIRGADTALSAQNVTGTITIDQVTIEGVGTGLAMDDASAAINLSNVTISGTSGNGMTLSNSGPVTFTTGSIYNAAGFGIDAFNTPLHLDGVTIGGANGIGAAGIAITTDSSVLPIDFSLRNSTVSNTFGSGLQIEAYNSARITSGTITGTAFFNNQGIAIDAWASEGAIIDNLVIGAPEATTPGDVTIGATGLEAIFITAGDIASSGDTGTVNVRINAVDIRDSYGETNILAEALGNGTLAFSLSHSSLDAAQSLYDNVFLVLEEFAASDTPSMTATLTDNTLANGNTAGFTADNFTNNGSLDLYLANNAADTGTIEPDYGFALYNDLAGKLTLYSTTSYTDAADLLFKQGNTGGVFGLLDSSGIIDITPLP